MYPVCDLLDPRSVEASLSAAGKRELMEELAGVLARSVTLPDRAALVEALMERERMASTGVGGGIALPHRLLAGFPRTAIALGRHRAGIAFDAADGAPVTLFFLIVGPAGAHAEHLRLLSRLARLLRDASLARELLAAEDAAAMLAALRTRDAG